MSAPTLAQKVSNIKHMPVLLAATSATKDPADGYLVKDIIKMSYESHQTRLFLQQYLVNLLITSNNVFSKIKVLRLFLDLLGEGHIEFKQNLRKTPEPFNEAAKLRPHQPKDQKLVGECGRIRDMANKVLDQLYTEVPELRRPTPAMDSSDYGGGVSSTSNGSSRITGFGNTTAPKPSTTDKLKALFGTSGSKSNPTVVYDPSYATMDPVPHNTAANSPFSVHVPSSNSYRDSDVKPAGLPHERGQAGGGWGTNDQPLSTNSRPSKWSAASYREEATVEEEEEQREHLSSTGEDLSSYEQTSTEQEQRLVDEITAPGGVKIAPPKESLNRFVARCKVLDSLSIVECLRLKLLSDEHQIVMRALFVIEYLLRSDIPDILSHLDIILQDLDDLTRSPNSSVQAKAKKISVQLLSANTQRVSGGSPRVADKTHQPTSTNDQEQVEEDEEEEAQGISSIFSGLSVSGEKTTHRTKPVRKKEKKQPSPSSATRSNNRTSGSARKTDRKTEEKKGFEDILGLGDLSADAQPQPTSEQVHGSTGEGVEPQLFGTEPEGDTAGDSLLTFEEDVEFDPLKRSDSVGLGGRTGSLSKKPVSAASQQIMEPSMSSPAVETRPPPPLTTQESLGHIQDLTGVDLSMTNTTGGGVASTTRQESLSELLYPLQTSSAPMMMASSSAGVVPGSIQIVSAPSGAHGQLPLGIQPGGVVYGGGAGQGQVPLTIQAGGGGVVYGGGVQTIVPVMYAAQGTAGLMYQQPQFRGVARPVQRAAVAKEQTPPPDAGFSFLGKTNKSNAFDFVQDEMKASRTKK